MRPSALTRVTPWPAHNRGNAYGDLGQFQRAIEDYDEAIRPNPEYADAYNNRGVAYVNLTSSRRLSSMRTWPLIRSMTSPSIFFFDRLGNEHTSLPFRRALPHM